MICANSACGKEFAAARRWQKYCSTPCQYAGYRKSALGKETLKLGARRWRKAHPGAHRSHQLKAAYRIILADFNRMLAAQGFRCAICEMDTPGGRGNWHVDHDHGTGAVRGLLCHNCNIGLGNFKDDRDRLERAIRYLDEATPVKEAHCASV